jgi:two-component system OmpR family response regulator
MYAAGSEPRILIVDDDRGLCGFLVRFLTREGYTTVFAHDGLAMRRAISASAFDLVILDLSFPRGEDGVTLARGLRAESDTPLIVLSGKSATVDKVVCLELGADDYVTKPFEPRELLARIRCVLRRIGGSHNGASGAAGTASSRDAITFSGWRLDLARRELKAATGDQVALTSREFELLAALAERPGRLLSRDQLLGLVANRRWAPDDRSVDVVVGKLRRKLGDDARNASLIKTIRGVGYMFSPAAE